MEQPHNQLKEDLKVLRIDRQSSGRREPRRKWVFVFGFIVIFSVGAVFVARKLGPELGLSGNAVRVAVASLRNAGGAQPVLSAGGYVIARHQVEVGSKITGRIIVLEVDEGDVVRQGQLIARLDDHEIRAQLDQADAALAGARARLNESEAGSRPQEIERARAEEERLLADLKNAETNLRRVEQLVNDGVLQQQALDDAQARCDMAQKAHRAASQDYELARIGPRQEQIDLARAQVREAQAALAFAQAQLENTIIRAPVAGTILDRYADLGEMVTTGFTSDRGAKQALVSIANLRDLQVEMDISEADIAKVQLHQPTTITPDAYQDRRYQGIVEYIADVADRQKATIQVKVKILDPDEYLRPDMGAKVSFYQQQDTVPEERATVMVPKTAIVNQTGRTVVFLAQGDKVVIQPVRTGPEDNGYVTIIDGLKGGERVITSGQESLEDGDAVRIQSQ